MANHRAHGRGRQPLRGGKFRPTVGRSSDMLGEIGNLDFYVQISDFQKYCTGQIKSRPAAHYFKVNFRAPYAAATQHTRIEKLSPINAGEDIMSLIGVPII